MHTTYLYLVDYFSFYIVVGLNLSSLKEKILCKPIQNQTSASLRVQVR